MLYVPYAVVKKGVKVLYLIVNKVIYGMLEASLLWYHKLRGELEEQDFVFNNYGPCAANREIEGSKDTIRFHVNDVLLSHIKSRFNDTIGKWCQEKYGSLKPTEICRGTIHSFLGMTLDFLVPGECRIKQFKHVRDLIEEWPEQLNENESAFTQASNHLFEKRGRLIVE